MEGYRFDPHVHTSFVSGCGKVHPEEMVRLYKEAGYSGVVVTDHYYDGYFEKQGDTPWAEKVYNYCSGYRAARELGEKLGLTVLFGQEMRFKEHANDYLAYGISPEDLIETPELYKLTLAEYAAYIRAKGGLLYQAHPFRTPPCEPADPACLDGVEVYNGHPGHNSRNPLALEFCEKHGLMQISGSDFHQVPHLARGGVIFPRLPKNEQEFISMLRAGEVSGLIKTIP